MTDKQRRMLSLIKGKTFTIEGKKVKIADFHERPEERSVSLSTNDYPIIVHQDNLNDWIDNLGEPVEDDMDSQALFRANVDTSSMRSLNSVLFNMLQKVEEDPKYIDQAKTMNEVAKTIVSNNRTQLEGVKLMVNIQKAKNDD